MTLARILTAPGPATNRLSFTLKAVLAGGLAFLADIVFSSGATLLETGSVAGLFALLWLAGLVICNPGMRDNSTSRLALGGAGLAALALLFEPGFLAALLFPIYVGPVLFLPRHGEFDDALRWLPRLAVYAILSPLALLFDLFRIGRSRRGGSVKLSSLFGGLTLTVAGSLIFITLFSDANPVIHQGLSQLTAMFNSPGVIELTTTHVLFLAMALIPLWSSFRPLHLRVLALRRPYCKFQPERGPRFEAGAILSALVAFNLIFAAQNLSDLAFLWGGASLPEGVTFSDYAHKGTNALIMTAVLAAFFVLVFLRTGSPLSANRVIRVLVYAWIGQTVLLVLSCMERTLNYIEAYSLTYTRLNALILMALVAAGLVLICWRIARNLDGSWLVNANALCVAVVLGLASFTNFDAVIARWNLADAPSGPFRSMTLDTDYLYRLGGSGALVPLAEASQYPAFPHADLGLLRQRMQMELEQQQADWRRWSIAGAWRLSTARSLPLASTFPTP